MNWPDVTVVVVTYDRPAEIRRTISALGRYLVYYSRLSWHLADDGSPDPYIADLLRDFPQLKFTATSSQRKGWAANANKALAFVKTDYVFLCEDDYVARRPLDLTRGVALLEAVPALGLVRYDGLSGHDLDLHLREAQTPAGCVNYLEIDKNSPHLHVYSNRPHLKHRRFHDYYGLYKAGLPLGQCEEDFAFRVKDDVQGPGVAALDDGILRAFEHVGRSRQGSEVDPCWKEGGLT